jgi:hypothetical protein
VQPVFCATPLVRRRVERRELVLAHLLRRRVLVRHDLIGVGYYGVGWSILGYVGCFGVPISFRAASVSARTAPSSTKIW